MVIKAGHWDKCLQKHHFHSQESCTSGYDDCIALTTNLGKESCISGYTAIWDLCCLKAAEGCSYSCVPDDKFEQVTSAPMAKEDIIAMIRKEIAASLYVLIPIAAIGLVYLTSFIYAII